MFVFHDLFLIDILRNNGRIPTVIVSCIGFIRYYIEMSLAYLEDLGKLDNVNLPYHIPYDFNGADYAVNNLIDGDQCYVLYVTKYKDKVYGVNTLYTITK